MTEGKQKPAVLLPETGRTSTGNRLDHHLCCKNTEKEHSKAVRKANWLVDFPWFHCLIGRRCVLCVFVSTCSILFRKFRMRSSRSDDEPSGEYALYYKSSYERNFVMQIFVKRGLTVHILFIAYNDYSLSRNTLFICRSQWLCGLWSSKYQDCGFRFASGNGCLSALSVLCCDDRGLRRFCRS
jgi:hypothetical protein